MKKFTGAVSAILSVLILLAATGCGNAKTPKDVDISAMAAAIIKSGAYTDSMSDKSTAAQTLYGIDAADLKQSDVYFSSMATAEECAVFEAVDSAAAGRILTACQTRQTSQVSSYENYVPTEVAKINAAVVAQSGNYVLYIVSNDQAAVKTVLAQYGFDIK